MNLTYKNAGEHIVIVVDGMIDSETSAHLNEESKKTIQNSCGNIIYDFSKIKYVSSAGIQVFYNLLSILEKNNRKMLFFNVNANVKRVFDIVALPDDIPLLNTETEALNYK